MRSISTLIYLFPIFQLLIFFISRNYIIKRELKYLFFIFQIFITTYISSVTTLYLKPGDYSVYTSIFNNCNNIDTCFQFSPWEPLFTLIVSSLGKTFNFSGHDLWTSINFLIVISLSFFSILISKVIKNKYNFISIQAIAIAYTFPSFLTISIRSGLSFCIVSIGILIYFFNKNNNKKLIKFLSVLLIISGVFIHIQSILLSFLGLVYIFSIKSFSLDIKKLVTRMQKGFVSGKFINLILLTLILGTVLNLFFGEIMITFGKVYYETYQVQTLGLRSLADFVISFLFIIPRIYKLEIYKVKKSFKEFFDLFVTYYLLTFLIYYFSILIIGFEGLARNSQFNFLFLLLLYITSIDRSETKKIFIISPVFYSIICIYYSYFKDVSFGNLFLN